MERGTLPDKDLRMPSTRCRVETRRRAAPAAPGEAGSEAVKNINAALNELLADVFALYIKTKNLHWHVSGPHFRDSRLLLDDQAGQIFAMTDDIAERVRKICRATTDS